MTAPREHYAADRTMRRVLFVLRLIDPIAQTPAGARLTAEAKGWGKPRLTSAGEFVWLDPPWEGPHQFKITVRSRDGAFAGFEQTFAVPDRPKPPKDGPPFKRDIDLDPTGLYTSPPGLLAVAGMLVDKPKPATALAKAAIRLIVRAEDGSKLISKLDALTDERGGFIAVARGFGDEKLALYTPPPGTPAGEPRPPEGAVAGQLEVTWNGATRRSRPFPLRPDALTRVASPLAWAINDLLPP